MTEIDIQTAIRLELGDTRRYGDLVIWRNSVGVLTDQYGKHVRFGVGGPGAGDLVGMFTCGDGRALWIEAEIKTPKGKQDELQAIRQQLVHNRGGEYVVLRSVEDARAWVESLRRRFV